MRNCEGEGQKHLEIVLDKIEGFLEIAQEDQEDIEIGKPTVQPAARNTTGSQRKSGNMFGEMNNEDSDIEETDHVSETVFVAYKLPRRDDDCRVCK